MPQLYDQEQERRGVPRAAARPRRRRRRRRRRNRGPLLFTAVILLGAAVIAWNARNGAPKNNNTGEIEVPEWIVQDLLPLNQWSRPGDALPQVNGVVVHYVGNPGTTAEQNRSYFAYLAETHETSASSHFVVGMDGTVIQCVLLNEISYCSNHRNADTIAIECCHPDETGKFTGETMDALTRLVDWLIGTYGLEREDILRHYDVTGKECPKYFCDYPDQWEKFLDGLTFGAK